MVVPRDLELSFLKQSPTHRVLFNNSMDMNSVGDILMSAKIDSLVPLPVKTMAEATEAAAVAVLEVVEGIGVATMVEEDTDLEVDTGVDEVDMDQVVMDV